MTSSPWGGAKMAGGEMENIYWQRLEKFPLLTLVVWRNMQINSNVWWHMSEMHQQWQTYKTAAQPLYIIILQAGSDQFCYCCLLSFWTTFPIVEKWIQKRVCVEIHCWSGSNKPRRWLRSPSCWPWVYEILSSIPPTRCMHNVSIVGSLQGAIKGSSYL